MDQSQTRPQTVWNFSEDKANPNTASVCFFLFGVILDLQKTVQLKTHFAVQQCKKKYDLVSF